MDWADMIKVKDLAIWINLDGPRRLMNLQSGEPLPAVTELKHMVTEAASERCYIVDFEVGRRGHNPWNAGSLSKLEKTKKHRFLAGASEKDYNPVNTQ